MRLLNRILVDRYRAISKLDKNEKYTFSGAVIILYLRRNIVLQLLVQGVEVCRLLKKRLLFLHGNLLGRDVK